VRRARADDKDAILAFASTTWDGWDYIPEAWEAWLTAGDGALLLVEAGGSIDTMDGRVARGQPIGISRLALLADGEAWLEGIRIDPRVRGRGVATALQVAEFAWARAQGARWIRYATGQENEASHRLGTRHGFQVLSRWRWFARHRADEDADGDAPPPASGPTAVTPHLLPPDTSRSEVDRLWRRVQEDPTFVLGGHLYEGRSWAFQALTGERFSAHVRASEVHVSEDGRAVAVAPHRAGWSEEHEPHIALLVGAGDAALPLIVDLRAAFGGRLNVRLPWPDPPIVNGRFETWAEAGFGTWGRHSLHVLGRPLGPEPEPAELGPSAVGLTYLEPPHRVATPRPIEG
jgi:GNAT superfamily N-acetyltransferase